MVTNPTASLQTNRCNRWLESLLMAGNGVIVPEIADYEVRRELLRAGRVVGVRALDRLKQTLDYLPLTTETMLLAAELWAETRRRGRPTADRYALDGDVILAAQAALLARSGDRPVIATTNPSHLTRFADAQSWEEIR